MVDTGRPARRIHARFSLRGLLTVFVIAAIVICWLTDRHILERRLTTQIAKLETYISDAERRQENRERLLLESVTVGDSVSTFPDILALADHQIALGHKKFGDAYDFFRFDYPTAGKKLEIIVFEIPNFGSVGDPFNFAYLLNEGVVVQLCSWEQLNG